MIHWIRVPGLPKSNAEVFEEKLDVHGRDRAFNDDGVDLTLIRQALDMTPLQRLRVVGRWARAILRARIVDGR